MRDGEFFAGLLRVCGSFTMMRLRLGDRSTDTRWCQNISVLYVAVTKRPGYRGVTSVAVCSVASTFVTQGRFA